MQRVVRHASLSSKSLPLNYPARRILSKRAYTTASESSQQIPRGQHTTLLLAGTALLSATCGYFLATYKSPNSSGTEEVHTPGRDNQQYGTARDFREAIKELKATFPKPGAVSDDPEVLEPYGFSEHDHHPGTCHCLTVDIDSR